MCADETPKPDGAANDPSHRITAKKRSSLFAGLEFFRFTLIAGAGGLYLAGYSHVHTVYRRFGLSLHEVGIGYLEALDFTIYMVRQPVVLYYCIGAIFAFSGAAAAFRYVFDDFGFYVWFAILLLLLAFSAGYAGSVMGNDYADRVMTDYVSPDRERRRGGRLAYCVLTENADIPKAVREQFQEMTNSERVRMIKQTEDRVFLYLLQSGNVKEAPNHGDHITFSMEDISFCRVSSGRGEPLH